MLKRLNSAVILIGTTLIVSVASAQSSDLGWVDSLRLQLQVDKDCEALYFLNLRESESATGNTYSARVQCEDGRRFDATRTDPATDFTFETCEQAVCEVDSGKSDKS